MAEESQEQKGQEEAQPVEEKQEQKNEATEQETVAEKGGESGAAAAGKKNQKINRMTVEELNEKIAALEKSGGSNSKYFKHLMERKNELGQETQ